MFVSRILKCNWARGNLKLVITSVHGNHVFTVTDETVVFVLTIVFFNCTGWYINNFIEIIEIQVLIWKISTLLKYNGINIGYFDRFNNVEINKHSIMTGCSRYSGNYCSLWLYCHTNEKCKSNNYLSYLYCN